MEQRSDVPAIRTLQNLIVLREHDQCLEIAVRDDMQLAVTKNGNLKKALKEAMQSQPELANKRVEFIVKPDVFPSTEVDLNAEFQKLKAKIPALKQLDDAFGLRPVHNPTP
ncbi:MAG: hypothetical protein F4Y64_05675 [Rhodothermaceae bacterium]|nr:hypothetical protein [Rhodothermaceae bacterium]MXZ57119.1 hypothetical protein [Rhodothermaceae bacterium]MYD68803.1 hypothetical protein [Rhodothermaceae bacterium]MYK64534.1 hypothetical protein [Rhodothermaceae bacterium]